MASQGMAATLQQVILHGNFSATYGNHLLSAPPAASGIDSEPAGSAFEQQTLPGALVPAAPNPSPSSLAWLQSGVGMLINVARGSSVASVEAGRGLVDADDLEEPAAPEDSPPCVTELLRQELEEWEMDEGSLPTFPTLPTQLSRPRAVAPATANRSAATSRQGVEHEPVGLALKAEAAEAATQPSPSPHLNLRGSATFMSYLFRASLPTPKLTPSLAVSCLSAHAHSTPPPPSPLPRPLGAVEPPGSSSSSSQAVGSNAAGIHAGRVSVDSLVERPHRSRLQHLAEALPGGSWLYAAVQLAWWMLALVVLLGPALLQSAWEGAAGQWAAAGQGLRTWNLRRLRGALAAGSRAGGPLHAALLGLNPKELEERYVAFKAQRTLHADLWLWLPLWVAVPLVMAVCSRVQGAAQTPDLLSLQVTMYLVTDLPLVTLLLLWPTTFRAHREALMHAHQLLHTALLLLSWAGLTAVASGRGNLSTSPSCPAPGGAVDRPPQTLDPTPYLLAGPQTHLGQHQGHGLDAARAQSAANLWLWVAAVLAPSHMQLRLRWWAVQAPVAFGNVLLQQLVLGGLTVRQALSRALVTQLGAACVTLVWEVVHRAAFLAGL
ncbi:hypothetical protein V8C86DRAFT_2464736 [Haematococcus lacustris]